MSSHPVTTVPEYSAGRRANDRPVTAPPRSEAPTGDRHMYVYDYFKCDVCGYTADSLDAANEHEIDFPPHVGKRVHFMQGYKVTA